MKRDRCVACAPCRGTGKISLERAYPAYAEALDLLPTGKWNRPITTREVAQRLGIAHTAACNRLKWLEDHGFATSEGVGSRHNPKRWRGRLP